MMEQLNTCDVDLDLEDGELSESSDEVYVPLQRPGTLTGPAPPGASTSISVANTEECSPLATCHQMQEALEEDESQSETSDSSSGESSDSCLKKLASDSKQQAQGQGQRKKRKRVKRTIMLRVQPTGSEVAGDKRARFKKYNIWTAALQEETLTENMRDCDVTLKGYNDRNVENYDYTQKYQLNGANSMKRRLSNSTDDFSDGELHSLAKRGRPSSRDRHENSHRRSHKNRMGQRLSVRGRQGSPSTSGSDNSYEPRHILDLDDPSGKHPIDVAREMANKLYEEKDELLRRIVEVLGLELPIEVYKATQRIEADGGMTVKHGHRRRTPGGVFLFLLKNHDRLTPEQQNLIFKEDQQATNKWRKVMKSIARDRKVEELKKRLNEKEKQLSTLKTRKEHFLLGSELNLENHTSLSNPPPSPVGQESNFEYKPDTINHVVADVISGKDSLSDNALTALAAPAPAGAPARRDELLSYDDDFLDINCGEMDFV